MSVKHNWSDKTIVSTNCNTHVHSIVPKSKIDNGFRTRNKLCIKLEGSLITPEGISSHSEPQLLPFRLKKASLSTFDLIRGGEFKD